MWSALVVLMVLWSAPAWAQEAWCLANPTNCVCAESYQDQSYTVTPPDNGFNALGNNDQGFLWNNGGSANTKHCYFDGRQNSFQARYGEYNDFRDMQIGSDATVLSRLPNRGTGMRRYLRPYNDWWGIGARNPSSIFAGYTPIDLTGIRRMAMRWYWYHSEDYEYTYQYHVAPHDTSKQCTNGKIASVGYGDYANQENILEFYHPVLGGNYHFYDNAIYQWAWPGHSNFQGFSSWADFSGGTPHDMLQARGKWYRWELVIRNPRAADGATYGFDYEFYVTNITDGGSRQKIAAMSNGCANCVTIGGNPDQNFTWLPGVHPLRDQVSLMMFDYRASDTPLGDGYCYGWQGMAYLVLAKWTTDAGQMIGSATEVEGGTSPPDVWAGTMTLTVISALLFLASGLIFGAVALVRRGRAYAARRTPPPPLDGGDSWRQPVRPGPVDVPPDRVEDPDLAGVAGGGSARPENRR